MRRRIRLEGRRVERRRDVADVTGAVLAQRDGDDVEAAARLAEALALEIVLGQADESALLGRGHGGAGGVTPASLAALHLDEDPAIALAADQIDFPAGQADGTGDDFEPGALQVACG